MQGKRIMREEKETMCVKGMKLRRYRKEKEELQIKEREAEMKKKRT
jgi:hypothetical protein